ncbi:MAG: DUF547 domain-containing protein [Bdellovibrionales bacterium]|nr:DUF547 domain-containing protein [Bdellovibrionales bacterium]
MPTVPLPNSRDWLVCGVPVLAVILLSAAVSVSPQRDATGVGQSASSTSAGAHNGWTELLRRYVDGSGNVDYAKWCATEKDLQRLDDYVASLSRMEQRQLVNKPQKLAFWINAYNAVTIRRILREYPARVGQIVTSGESSPTVPNAEQFVVNDTKYSLDDIEHSVLRQLSDPRIHFAIVCGARGCPRLRDEAYEAERLEEQLEQNARNFFADVNKLTVDEQRKELRLSPILEWYATDFGASSSDDILQSITPWLPNDARKFTKGQKMRVIFNDYDWTLNDQKQVMEPPLPPPELPMDKK